MMGDRYNYKFPFFMCLYGNQYGLRYVDMFVASDEEELNSKAEEKIQEAMKRKINAAEEVVIFNADKEFRVEVHFDLRELSNEF